MLAPNAMADVSAKCGLQHVHCVYLCATYSWSVHGWMCVCSVLTRWRVWPEGCIGDPPSPPLYGHGCAYAFTTCTTWTCISAYGDTRAVYMCGPDVWVWILWGTKRSGRFIICPRIRVKNLQSFFNLKFASAPDFIPTDSWSRSAEPLATLPPAPSPPPPPTFPDPRIRRARLGAENGKVTMPNSIRSSAQGHAPL